MLNCQQWLAMYIRHKQVEDVISNENSIPFERWFPHDHQMTTMQHIAAKPRAMKKTFQRRWFGEFSSGGRISKNVT